MKKEQIQKKSTQSPSQNINESTEHKDTLILPCTSRTKKIVSVVLCVLFLIFTFISTAALHAAYWVTDTYDETTFEQILFNMMMPLDGVDPNLISSAVKTIGTPAILATIIAALIYVPLTIINGFGMVFTKKTKISSPDGESTVSIKAPAFVIHDRWYLRILRIICWIAILLILLKALIYANDNFSIFEYFKAQLNSSSFIEDNYADPSKTKLTFPEKKKNLIYIFLESTETTFTSKENGGAFSSDVIAELAEMMKNEEYTHFSNTDKLGGAISTVGATWTMGGMFAQSSGLPLKLPLNYNNHMSISDTFLSYTTCLGDILEENGYEQAIIMGSNGEFGGRSNYYTIHGNQTIYDWYTADDDGIRDENYYKNYWGLQDKDLYAYAKQVLGNLSSQDEPFALTLLTVDTHFSNGYPCDLCTNYLIGSDGNFLLDANGNRRIKNFKYFPKQYSNIYSCASKQIYSFVEWLSEQDFFEDTTIVISGDHNTMDANYTKYIASDYIRTPVNVIINSSVDASKTKNRYFSTMDMFPTTLAAMGVKIEGDRLGLGTNLFSDKQTLIEKHGIEYFETEIGKKSNFYNQMLFAK